MGIEVAWDHAQSFISATFSGAERHVRRLTKVARLEDPSTSIKLVDRISSVRRTTVATNSPRRSADGLPRQVTRLSQGGSAAWFKSWVFQVTVQLSPVPGLDGGGSFCRRTDSRLRNAGSGSSPACLTRAGGVDLSVDTDREKRASFDRQATPRGTESGTGDGKRGDGKRGRKAGRGTESGTGKRDGDGKAGRVRYWQYGQAERSPALAISDPSRFLAQYRTRPAPLSPASSRSSSGLCRISKFAGTKVWSSAIIHLGRPVGQGEGLLVCGRPARGRERGTVRHRQC